MTKEIIENDPYKLAGVDIDAGNNLIDKIKKSVAASHNQNVLNNIGGFAGMYELDKDIDNPVLVACTDGVGTKVSLAQEFNDLSGIGQDLVAMCVNDLIVCGAKPLFFLDYYASSKLNVNETTTVIKSIADACIKSDCALLGGETAEMPGHYIDNNFDLAGFSVGCVSKDKIIKNDNVMCDNVAIGIESSGPHSNGFSLIRKIIKESKLTKEEKTNIAKNCLKPTLLYPRLIMELISNYKINALSHITGGGLTENLPRSITNDLCVEIDTNSWEMPNIFKWLKENGNISDSDMYRIFNCGIGRVLFVDKDQVLNISKRIKELDMNSFVIGTVKDKKEKSSVIFV